VTASCLGVVNLVWGGEVSTHRQEKLKEPLYTLVISRVKRDRDKKNKQSTNWDKLI
jgi:hypothetical protein